MLCLYDVLLIYWAMNLVVSIVTSTSFITGYERIEIVIGPKNVLGTTPGNSK